MQVLCPYRSNRPHKSIDRCVVLSLKFELSESKTIDKAFISYMFTVISLEIKIWLSNKF